jgi:hypothetical protein
MGFMDTFNNMTPFDEIANAGMAAGRKLGRVAGQGTYGLGRAVGTGTGALGRAVGTGAGAAGSALSRMAGMGVDVAQGVGRYGMQGAGAATRGLGAAGRFVGESAMDNFQRQADLAETLGRGVGGAAMGAGRGFMDGLSGAPGRVQGGMGAPIMFEGRPTAGYSYNPAGNNRSGFMNALRSFSNRPRYDANGVPLR